MKRGIALSATMIAGAISANSVHAAPIGLATSVTAAAIQGTTVTTTTLTLVKGTMKIMTWMKMKTALAVGTAALLITGAATVAFDRKDEKAVITARPSATEILQKSRDAYASLISYSDTGYTESSIGETTVAPHTFIIKMARPNLYLVEWAQKVHANYTNSGVVWSDGTGDFFTMGGQVMSLPVVGASKPAGAARKHSTRTSALGAATGVSGSASATIPAAFFEENWGNVLKGPILSSAAVRHADEKIGDVDCYVLSSDLPNASVKTTLWIGKQDFLIRKRQTVSELKGDSLGNGLTPEARKQAEAVIKTMKGQTVTATETHENIVVNEPIDPASFRPQGK